MTDNKLESGMESASGPEEATRLFAVDFEEQSQHLDH